MSDIAPTCGLMWGAAEEFMAEDPEYAWEQRVLAEAADRLPSGPPLALADLSESVATAFGLGMDADEVLALINIMAAHVAKMRPGNLLVAGTVDGGGFT